MEGPIGSGFQGRVQGLRACSVFPPVPPPWRRAVPQCQPLLGVPAAQTLAELPRNSAGEANTGGQDWGSRIVQQGQGAGAGPGPCLEGQEGRREDIAVQEMEMGEPRPGGGRYEEMGWGGVSLGSSEEA